MKSSGNQGAKIMKIELIIEIKTFGGKHYGASYCIDLQEIECYDFNQLGFDNFIEFMEGDIWRDIVPKVDPLMIVDYRYRFGIRQY
jgi:hypothetical protein